MAIIFKTIVAFFKKIRDWDRWEEEQYIKCRQIEEDYNYD